MGGELTDPHQHLHNLRLWQSDKLSLQAGHDILSLTDGHREGSEGWLDRKAGIYVQNAGGQLALQAGHDIRLSASEVVNQGEGGQTSLIAGHDLTITSQQDSDRYDSKQSGVSAGGSVSYGTSGWGGSASVSATRDKMHSNFDSVKEQSGLYAGKGGFDVTVGSHTQLNGGVIASTADKDKNRLSTGTLGFEDIHNKAEYKTEHAGASLSTGGSYEGQFIGNLANGMLAGLNNSDSKTSTTHAAVSDGTIEIRDKAHQQQDVSQLSRD